jgi:hypothetical protein
MTPPTTHRRSKSLTVRVTPELHEELTAAASRQGWTVNEEINQRLRAGPILEHLQTMSAEIVELKAMMRDMQN